MLLLRRQPRHLLLLLLLPMLVMVPVLVVVVQMRGSVVSRRLIRPSERLSRDKGVFDGLSGCPPGLRVRV
jgi:hypothetical protein